MLLFFSLEYTRLFVCYMTHRDRGLCRKIRFGLDLTVVGNLSLKVAPDRRERHN